MDGIIVDKYAITEYCVFINSYGLVNMTKNLFFAVALIIAPCLALAANPSTNLSVQVVPAGQTTSAQCPATAPPEAAQAGFTTMALCNDFTQTIPNTAGTGLPSNWFGCYDNNNPHIFYMQEGSCNIAQVTDPNFGGLTLDLKYSVADGQSVTRDDVDSASPTVNNTLDPTQQSLFLDFPIAHYIQIVGRTTSFQVACASGVSTCTPNGDFWEWPLAQQIDMNCGTGNNPNQCVIEHDLFEDFANGSGGGNMNITAFHMPGGAGGNGADSAYIGSPTYDTTQYHTFASLITSDGSSNIIGCGYIDGVLSGCVSVPQAQRAIEQCGAENDNQGTYCQRDIIKIWFDSFNNFPPGAQALASDQHFYIKSIQVWACQNWQRGSTGTNPNCFGGPNLTTGSDGSQFYQVTTQ